MDESPLQSIDEFLDAHEESYREFDRLIANHLEKSEKPITCFTCTNTEPGCCFQKNIGPFYEFLTIARYVKRQGLDTPAFRDKLREVGNAMEGAERKAWFHEGHPCIFLEGGRCSIYPIRPSSCRLYYVVTPQEKCQPTVVSGIAFVNFEPLVDIGIARAKQIHQILGLKETPMRILMGVLPRMVLIALEALESDDYQETIRNQIWPTVYDLDNDWVDGKASFQERLYQIRKKPD